MASATTESGTVLGAIAFVWLVVMILVSTAKGCCKGLSCGSISGFMWTQKWAHILAVLVLPFFFAGIRYSIDGAIYQGVAHLFLLAVCISSTGSGDLNAKRRSSDSYWFAAWWAIWHHFDYFAIFMARNLRSESDPTRATPWRAMENEVATINRLFLLPLGFKQDSSSLCLEFANILLEFSSSTGTGEWYSGYLIFWYQMYEGIIHGLIILGAIVYVSGCKGKLADMVVYVGYEWGMVLELVTYGPLYFWVISVMWIGSFYPSLIGLSFVPSTTVQALATGFGTHHHAGYILDTWGTYQIAKVWGAYRSKRKTKKS